MLVLTHVFIFLKSFSRKRYRAPSMARWHKQWWTQWMFNRQSSATPRGGEWLRGKEISLVLQSGVLERYYQCNVSLNLRISTEMLFGDVLCNAKSISTKRHSAGSKLTCGRLLLFLLWLSQLSMGKVCCDVCRTFIRRYWDISHFLFLLLLLYKLATLCRRCNLGGALIYRSNSQHNATLAQHPYRTQCRLLICIKCSDSTACIAS